MLQNLKVSLVQPEGLYSWTGHCWRLCTAWWIPLVRLTLRPSRLLLTSAHTEDSSERAQEQGQFQDEQEQEVESTERNPVGDTVTGNKLPPQVEAPGPFFPHLSLGPDSRAPITQDQI